MWLPLQDNLNLLLVTKRASLPAYFLYSSLFLKKFPSFRPAKEESPHQAKSY
jgi:hypothetical protein